MTDTSERAFTIPAPRNDIGVARDWLAGAWRLFQRDPWLWSGVAALYLLAAILLKRIPFMGNLVLVLLTPIPLAGALLLARNQAKAPPGVPPALPAGWRHRLDFLVKRPLAVCGRALKEEGFGFPLAQICIVVLGLTMVAIIVEIVLAGGSALTWLTGSPYAAGPLRVTTLFGIAISLALYALLAMALFHLLPLVLFRHQPAITAIVESLRAWRRAPLPLAIYGGGFVLLYALIAVAFQGSATHWLGYLLVFSFGLVALPLFVIGLYLSYRTLHGKTPVPGAHP